LFIVTRRISGLIPSAFDASLRLRKPFFSNACMIISDTFIALLSSRFPDDIHSAMQRIIGVEEVILSAQTSEEDA
jgi:hypothetical protein